MIYEIWNEIRNGQIPKLQWKCLSAVRFGSRKTERQTFHSMHIVTACNRTSSSRKKLESGASSTTMHIPRQALPVRPPTGFAHEAVVTSQSSMVEETNHERQTSATTHAHTHTQNPTTKGGKLLQGANSESGTRPQTRARASPRSTTKRPTGRTTTSSHAKYVNVKSNAGINPHP